MDNQVIGMLELRNQGGFVVRMDIMRKKDGREDRLTGSRHDITLGNGEIVDPGLYGVNDGDEITVYAEVVWGSDAVGPVFFEYKKGSNGVAKFTISGTTLNNDIGFNEIHTR